MQLQYVTTSSDIAKSNQHSNWGDCRTQYESNDCLEFFYQNRTCSWTCKTPVPDWNCSNRQLQSIFKLLGGKICRELQGHVWLPSNTWGISTKSSNIEKQNTQRTNRRVEPRKGQNPALCWTNVFWNWMVSTCLNKPLRIEQVGRNCPWLSPPGTRFDYIISILGHGPANRIWNDLEIKYTLWEPIPVWHFWRWWLSFVFS